MTLLLQAYETWLYEKQYKAAMEDLYTDITKKKNFQSAACEERAKW